MNAPFRRAAPDKAAKALQPRADLGRVFVCVSDDDAVRSVMAVAASAARGADLEVMSTAEFYAKGLQPPVQAVFAHVGSASALARDEIAALARVGEAVPLILVLDELDTVADARLALRLKAVDLMVTPLSADQIGAAFKQAQERGGHTPADVTAVISAVGGAGGTSLAITLADHLANAASERQRTCLIDLDTLTGACGLNLDAQCTYNIAEDAGDLHRVDGDYLDVVMKRVGSLGVFSVRANSEAEGEGCRRVLMRALDILERDNDALVLDLPHWTPARDLAVLAVVNRVFLVTIPTVPALTLALDKLDRMEAAGCPRSAVTVVINRFKPQLFSNRLEKQTIHKMMDGIAVAEIRDDDDVLTEAVNCGVPPRTVGKRSPMVKDAVDAYAAALGQERPALASEPRGPAAMGAALLAKFTSRDKARSG